MNLVEGRECGECRVCCVATHIDTEEFRKLPGVRCPHLGEGGCSIYATRYSVCRTYFCGWRYLEFLSDDWRPDRSGVLLVFTPENELPAGYETGISLVLDSPPPRGFTRALYHYVAHLISAGVLVRLAVPGPPGHYPAVTVLNETLKQAAARRDHTAFEAAFTEALALRDQPDRFSPAAHRHGAS